MTVAESFADLNAEGVRKLATAPRPFGWPAIPSTADGKGMVVAWTEAVAEAAQVAGHRAERAGVAHHVTMATREVIAGKLTELAGLSDAQKAGRADQSRAVQLWRAAANLGECGVPFAATVGLLQDAGLDCGHPWPTSHRHVAAPPDRRAART